MGDRLDYQSGIDREAELKQWRRRFWTITFCIAGGLIALVVAFVGEWIYHDTHIMIDADLMIDNRSTSTIDRASFYSIVEQRVGSVGPVAPGQTLKQHLEINEDECPCDFVFDQAGQTFYVPLGGPNADHQTRYDITIEPGKLTAVLKVQGRPTKTFLLTPTTQPIRYLK